MSRPPAAPANVDRRSSPYDDDPMVRLTGLSLDPDFPPSQHNNRASGNQQASRDSDAAAQEQQPSSASAKNGNNSTGDQSRTKTERKAGADDSGEGEDAQEVTHEGDQGDDEHAQHGGPQEHDGESITLRALVSSREAGVIIGKGGKNVAEVREKAGVRAGVSKVVQGVHERIMTVSGALHNVSQAYGIVARHLLENPTSNIPPAHPDWTTIRLLVSHQLMGSVIGKAGSRIREIQEESGAKIVVSKELLPQSTERVIDIYGLADSIQIAVNQIGECILNDYDRAAGTILYTPQPRTSIRTSGLRHDDGPLSGGPRERRRSSLTESPASAAGTPTYGGGRRFSRPAGPNGSTPTSANRPSSAAEEGESQTLAIPADMIGCIIGKGGSFINQIRRASGARLRIDDVQEGQTERVVTISGTDAATKKALNLLYQQLETEKQRRLGGGHGGRDGAEFEGGDL
ncbi:RNA binding protein, heterogenous nuclear RNP-K like protein [Rhizophlyctis rosea]|uniref:RNA binding protein, heterogenous nuclear RNP-K like protein n=1 Tax=Rhizophlyctis rosea TaxID=64517 RepID=A0AAD5X4U7_9FUNG|nr:RNA binding protein, heterogenous nuclear RNP-K like protein [Rhizophlyctis rosea]